MSRTDRPTVVTPAVLRAWALPDSGSDKDGRGQLVVVGGTSSTPGAVLLAGESGLRAGAGKLTIATVAPTAPGLAVAVPESRVVGLAADDAGSLALAARDEVVELLDQADVGLLGPGFSDPATSSSFVGAVVRSVRVPVVVDALASSYLTDNPEGLHHLDGQVVLTVNPTELARTAGVDEEEVEQDPLTHAAVVARRSRVVVVCGGTEKHVATPEGRAWVVQNGNPGLGTSGSGDVQAGIVAGLLARGAEPAQAAVWGAYVHASAGDRLAERVAPLGFLARELPAEIPAILAGLA